MSQVKFCRRINIFQIIAIVSAIGNFAYITFVEYSSKGLEAFRDKAFMHDIWYPFEWERHMNVVIFLQMYYLIIGGSINVASLTTLVVLISYGAIKLRLLQIKIKDIKNNSHETQVKNLLKEHQYIISFMHSLNEKTKYVMLMEFCLNSINLAIAVMQGLMAKDLASLAYSASLLFLVVLQVFIIAWVSNDIKIQSLAIGDAIYNCKWYDQSRSIKDLLRLVIVRAQTPLLLTIGPFGPMTNETALTMVKAAYTYLTVMRNFYK
ncbi:odorant receptor Or2-like [Anthonomus grandis grandis]|uniref:odorant receptor Or2-like n=1 Tax=Anthonomus grandis grandis TaxID=2921223 RepID=UPI002166174E|nr:odorant receptor Or2-like [Anthonomus grandis grandis]